MKETAFLELIKRALSPFYQAFAPVGTSHLRKKFPIPRLTANY